VAPIAQTLKFAAAHPERFSPEQLSLIADQAAAAASGVADLASTIQAAATEKRLAERGAVLKFDPRAKRTNPFNKLVQAALPAVSAPREVLHKFPQAPAPQPVARAPNPPKVTGVKRTVGAGTSAGARKNILDRVKSLK
jgi:hypothetical protein